MEWQDMETAPKDGELFLALNHDGEIWLSRYTADGRLTFRTNGRRESTSHVDRELADGTRGMVRDDARTKEAWFSEWTLWARLYEFKPTDWSQLPTPRDAREDV